MQVFANIGTVPVRKATKTTGKTYYEFRICESQRGSDSDPCWYTVRVMKDADLGLVKGDFVKVTGKLKTDFYLSREGKPTGTLLILAFEAAKIAKQPAPAAEAGPAAA
ncbi:single-strand-binding protein/primosomal replication protein n [Cupriavidus necator]|uniref:Single-strand-binding protein/primosomal replication protein n n=2 Tax=Cupriavidus necator TaxID=106590 RepID=A0A1U9UUU1_CUPNE|nr:single-strand-binding protein/primosomal replication protein n [Cupriavidus necator]